MRGEDELIPVVMRLRGAAPQAWEEFVMVMRRLAAIKAAELVRAPHETIYQVQGQARAWEEISTMLLEAPKNAQKAEDLANGKRAAANARPSNASAAGY